MFCYELNYVPLKSIYESLNPLTVPPHNTTVFGETTFFFFFCLFRAAPAAYGGSQTRGPVGAVAASTHHSHSQHGIGAASANYTTAHNNTGSSTH